MMRDTAGVGRAGLPPGAVTGIGSLPHTDPYAAVRCVAESCPQIPFWPQLPQRSRRETMLDQALGGLTEVLLWRNGGCGYAARREQVPMLCERLSRLSGALDILHAAGFFAFEDALAAGVFPDAVALKGQITGPLTLASLVCVDDTPVVLVPELLEAIGGLVTRLARWQVSRLARWNKPVLLFLDEPLLGLLAPEARSARVFAVLARVVEHVRAMGALVGLHSCATPAAAVPSDDMCRVHPDIVSFDAYYGLDLFAASSTARAFVQRGGMVAFGLVPTWDDLSQLEPAALFHRWQQASQRMGHGGELAPHTLVTASCGLGLLSEAGVRASFALAHAVGKQVRQHCGS